MTSTDMPIACSLSPSDLSARLAQIGALGRDALISADGTTLRFRNDASTREALAAIVAAESKCCSFLDLRLESSEGELVLSIAAPEGAEPVARDLAAAFAREAA